MDKYLLGIDNGGSDIKCAIFTLDGKEVATSSTQVKINVPIPGFTEREAEDVWQANIKVIKECIDNAKINSEDIVSIGITAYGNGLVFVDENINAVYPAIVSTDDRGKDYCKKFKSDGTERKIFPLTRQTTWSAQPAILIPWFRDNKKEVLEKTRWILSMKDYIRYRLTGKLYGELTEASSTCLVNLDTKQYDKFIFDTIGISDCFDKMPPILNSTDIAGYISEEVAELTGLKANTIVAAGYFDIDANALASGINSDDELCLIAGTWSINEFLTKDATTDYDKRTNIATLSYVDGLYLMEDSTPTSASNFNWYIEKIIKEYNKDITNSEIYNLCNELVKQRNPKDSDVIFVPYLFSSATNPNAHAAFLNVKASDDHVSLIRAIYEGVIFSSVHHVHSLQRPISTYSKAKLSGGVTNSDVWSQMMADALQIPIQTLDGSQIGAKGAAIGAGVACKEFSSIKDGIDHMVHLGKIYYPRKEYADIYKKKYERYECALNALDSLAESIGD